MTDHALLSRLAATQDWPELLRAACAAVQKNPDSVQALLFAGLAKLRLGHASEACAEIRRGLSIAPGSRWGVFLLSEALMQMGKMDAAIAELGAHLVRHADDEQAKATLVNALSRAGQFEQAQVWNDSRKAAEPLKRARNAVVVQMFIKADTLNDLFDSLCRCSGTRAFDLFVIQDSIVGSPKFSQFAEKHRETTAVLAKWLPTLLERFSRVECCANAFNAGTTATCRKALDAVCEDYDGFLFFEDDCVLAPNALDWMRTCLEEKISADGPLFVAGESKFLRPRRGAPHQKSVETLRRTCADAALRNAYIAVDSIPSTCFGTNAAIWRSLGGVRGFPLGDTALDAFLKARGRLPSCILPIVPRVKDVGMLHEYGYSVAHHGRDRIGDPKATLLLSDADVVREEVVEVQASSPILAGLAL